MLVHHVSNSCIVDYSKNQREKEAGEKLHQGDKMSPLTTMIECLCLLLLELSRVSPDQELACFDEYSSSLSLWCEQRSHGVSPTPTNAAHIAVRTSSCDETTEGGGGGWSRAVVTKVVDPKR